MEIVGAKLEEEDLTEKPGAGSSTPYLDHFGEDLTHHASEGKMDPVIGRRDELLQVIRTLNRKSKNNPLLVGEAGIGKTAIVKGLAQRIVSGNISPSLKGKRIIELNMGALVAGTKYRGEFEERLIGIVNEVKSHPEIIIFIDEIHTMVGAGKGDGSLDASNIIKPALSSGELRCIGATTLSEYRRYIEKDPALDRRFQPVVMEEPTPEETLEILRGIKSSYEKHHNVTILPGALEKAVKLSIRYLPDRRLPDKALDIIDEACSRVKISSLSFYENKEEIRSITVKVTEEIIAKVVSDWSGCPIEKAADEEKLLLSNIEEELKKKIVGQDTAIEKVAQVIKISRTGLRDPGKPVGVFLFLGPTGVGKTELAKTLAGALFGSEKDIIRLDMSEYMEKHSVAKLIGAPPGYVGYEEEGQLTGRLRTRPYTIVLLDEIEKAHYEIHNLFLQVFDEGRLTDAKGRTVDARNAIFIMTSNLGTEIYRQNKIGIGFMAEEEKKKKDDIQVILSNSFRPEFLNRIDEIIFFNNLDEESLLKITLLILDGLRERLLKQNISLIVGDNVLSFLCKEAYDPNYGARPLARTIERLIIKPLGERLLRNKYVENCKVVLDIEDNQIVFKT